MSEADPCGSGSATLLVYQIHVDCGSQPTVGCVQALDQHSLEFRQGISVGIFLFRRDSFSAVFNDVLCWSLCYWRSNRCLYLVPKITIIFLRNVNIYSSCIILFWSIAPLLHWTLLISVFPVSFSRFILFLHLSAFLILLFIISPLNKLNSSV